MKKVLISLCILFCLTFSAFSLDLQDVDVSQIDLNRVDLSGVDFYFHGPMEIYVTGVEYEGVEYAAVLDYDGAGTFTVKVPETVTTSGKPMSMDLSELTLSMTDEGIRISNLMIDGYDYSGSLAYVPKTDFQIASFSGREAEDKGADPAELAKMRNRVRLLESELEEKEQTIKARESMIEEKDQKITQLEQQAQETTKPGRTITGPPQKQQVTVGGVTIPELPSRTVLSSIKSPSSTYGDWSASGSTARQTDETMLDAKYVMSLPQNQDEYLYTFTASSSDSAWTGHGLHFLGSGSEKNGYGFGKSYLVWITRDANVQTDKPFVQIYKSFNDTWMVQVASQQIDVSVTQPLQVDTYVNTITGLIGVAVNGDVIMAWHDPDPITRGNSVAFRALHKATFQGLTVKAE
jgi:hypothetical protein